MVSRRLRSRIVSFFPGALDVVVIDSVAALVPKGELEGEMGDSKMGLRPLNEPGPCVN